MENMIDRINKLCIDFDGCVRNILIRDGNHVPEWMSEPGIIGGYRKAGITVSECLLSILIPSNETLNVWTHLLAGMYFLYETLTPHSDSMKFVEWNDSYYWPYLILRFSTINYLLVSAIAHSFNAVSEKVHHVLFTADFLSLSIYGIASGFAFKTYSYTDGIKGSLYDSLFVAVSLLLSVGTVLSRKWFAQKNTRVMMGNAFRILALAFLYVWTNLPIVHRMIQCEAHECNPTSFSYFRLQYVTIILVGVLYTTKVPERFWPGKFDIIGHSHQLFHVAGIATSYIVLQAVASDVLRSGHNAPNSILNVSYFLYLASANCLVFIISSVRILTDKSRTKENYSIKSD